MIRVTKERKKELLRFMGVGTVSFLLDYVLLNLFASWFKLPILVANSFSALISTYLNYQLNKHVVFEDKMHGERKTLLIYASIIAFGIFVIQNTVLHLTADGIAVTAAEAIRPAVEAVGLGSLSDKTVGLNLAKALATFLAAIWNYFMVRRYAFVTKEDLKEN